jgi:hypothetical protein
MSEFISDLELGWIIGILEGEGSFRYAKGTQDVGINVTLLNRKAS